MAKQKNHNIEHSRRRKWPWIVLFLVLLLGVTARLSLKSSLVHSWVRNQLLRSAGQLLNGQLQIGQLQGDLWKEIKLVDVSIVQQDTVFKADTLYSRYHLLSYFSSELQIDSIRIDNPHLELEENGDGTLNVQSLLRESQEDTASSSPFFFNINSFSISDGSMNGYFPSLAPDSAIALRDLNLKAGLGYRGKEYNIQLQKLGFNIEQTRLPAITVNTAARATEQQITLENLVIATGRSLLETSGTVNQADTSVSMTFSARPLSWQDISAYVEPSPLQRNLQFELSAKGSLRDFEIGLQAEAEGLQQFNLTTDARWDSTLEIQQLALTAQSLDLATLLGDSTYPSLKNLDLKVGGKLNPANFRHTELKGTFAAQQIQQGKYAVDKLTGTVSLIGGNLQADAQVQRGREQLQASLSGSGIWREQPMIRAQIKAQNIQPAYWLDDESYEGTINASAQIEGEGYELSDRFWKYQLNLQNSRIGGQSFSSASFNGQVNASHIDTKSQIKLEKGELDVDAEIENYLEEPSYQYNLSLKDLDLAGIKGMEGLPTDINGNISGEGRNITPEKLQLTSTIRIDSSIINKELLKSFEADVKVSDTVAQISNARLISSVVDGNFDARFNLLHPYDIKNQLDMDLSIKDIQSFAALADVDQLQTEGKLTGQMRPVSTNELQFRGSVNLNNLVYGDILSANRVEGDVETQLSEEPEFSVNLSLSNPVISSIVLRDFSTTIQGKVAPDSTYGNFQFTFSSPSNSRIEQSGRYSLNADSSLIRTDDLKVISDLRTLALAKPFDIFITGQSFRMDTLRLASDDGAMLEMAVPRADSVSQQGYLRGQNLNMTVIQNTLLNDSYFEGILSGRIDFFRQDTLLASSGDVVINNLVYKGASFDSLDINYKLEDERFQGGLDLYNGKEQVATGQLQLPFKLGDPETFDPSFFEQEVSGFLDIKGIAASRFKEMFTDAGLTSTGGQLSFSGHLSGTAGQPEMNALFRLRNATISGVAIDSVTASLNYVHTIHQLKLEGVVTSLGQQAAEITASVPVQLDLKNFKVTLPGKEDTVQAEVNTNQFNLASLNDFVDRSEYRGINGSLNGQVNIAGPLDNLATNGQLMLRNGTIRIEEAGLRLTDIQSTVDFDGNTVHLQQLRAHSGNGTFQASGSIDLNRLQPGNIDISMIADNFRIANTSDYAAIIDMNTTLGGTFYRPDLRGSLSFVSGFVYLQNFGEKSVEEVQLDSTVTEENNYAVSFDSLSLDMDVSFNNRFYVRNRRFLDLEYELEGQVDMLKNRGGDLQLFGTLQASDGYARPLGKQFELEKGVITFSGDPTNPELNIRHIFEPPQKKLGDVKIWYTIEGTVENPQFKYESDPPMGLEDIISYTLFGKPFMSLDPWKQVVANSGSNTSVADVAMDVLLDKVETLATQELGIDVVQIDNSRSGSSAGTSIKTGWYLNPRVFFAIQNNISGSMPDTIFTLEYLLQKNLKLIITQGSDSQTGLDIEWNYDY